MWIIFALNHPINGLHLIGRISEFLALSLTDQRVMSFLLQMEASVPTGSIETMRERDIFGLTLRTHNPGLMTFDERGVPIPVNPFWPLIKERVEVTTKTLELDSARLKDARQRHWRQCKDWIDELRELLPMDQADIDLARHRQIDRMMNNLRRMTLPDQPYSSVAKACLRADGLEFLIASAEYQEAA